MKRLGIWMLVLGLAACSSLNQDQPEVESTPVAADTETIDGSLATMASLFAQAVADEGVRRQIHEGVSARFDGDNNVLYQTLIASEIETQGQTMSLRHALADALVTQGTLGVQGETDALRTLDTLVRTIPNFNVAVPVKLQQWNVAQQTPLVGYAPIGVDDMSLEYIEAFDASGEKHLLDAQTDPKRPVIILGVNERTDEAGNVLPEFDKETASVDSEPVLEVQRRCRGVRVRNVRLKNDFEPWAYGLPEIGLKARAFGKGRFISRSGFPNVNYEGVTYRPNRRLGCTRRGVYLVWWENDVNIRGRVQIKYRGVGIGISFNRADDRYGVVAQRYGQFNRYTTRWNLGGIKFGMN